MATSLARAVTGAVCGGGLLWQELEQGSGNRDRNSTAACSSSAFGAMRLCRSRCGDKVKVAFQQRVVSALRWDKNDVDGSSNLWGWPSGLWVGGNKRPVGLTRGVNGAFWEGADSESTADVYFTSEDELHEKKEQSLLLNLIQEIEPLDVSIISKDASPDSTGAMKRTISGMLGLLPSDQFQVTIETPPDHLARLLVSSMMTGYTLRNAEYLLCLQRSLDLADEDASDLDHVRNQGQGQEQKRDLGNDHLSGNQHNQSTGRSDEDENTKQTHLPDELGYMSPEVSNYIKQLEEKLLAASKELEDCKNVMSSLEIVRQEKNDLLDYLRSLESEKVAELSQPSAEVNEAVEQVVAGLLGTMVPKPQPASIPPFGTGSIASPWEECGSSEVVGNVPLQFQSTVTSSRDYLARLLFWCTLLGYHMRGLEYRLELSRTLSLSGESVLHVDDDIQDM